jgi:hypothetical protein
MKHPITKLTTDLNNIQALPDVIIGQAVSLKTTFDESGNDIKAYVNTVLTEELNGSNGANKIGLTNPNLSADNVGDGVEEVRQIAVQAQGGTILPNSITNEQLSADVKVGSLGSLTTTNKTSVTASINELDAEVGANTGDIATNTANISTTALNLDILRTAKITTGSSVALTVDTDGTFDLTRNGNILHIIPNVTSTGGMTINVDGQGAIGIRKANDAGTLVALEAGDIKINVPTQLVRDTVNNFFVYAPRGGGGLWLNDWNAYDQFYKLDGVGILTGDNSYRTFVDITNKEGYLIFCRGFNTEVDNTQDIRITIDGVAKIFESVLNLDYFTGNEVHHPIYFKNSLKVEVFNSGGTNRVVGCDYLYVTKNSSPSSKKQQIIDSSLRRMGFSRGAITTNTNIINISGSGYFLGSVYSGYYSTAGGDIKGTIIIDGVTIMNDRTLIRTNDRLYKQFYIPGFIRFNTSLQVIQRTTNTGSIYNSRVWYTLD